MSFPEQHLLTIVLWLVAVVLGIMEYARSKGRIGKTAGVVLGAAFLGTILTDPNLIITSIPHKIDSLINWALGQ